MAYAKKKKKKALHFELLSGLIKWVMYIIVIYEDIVYDRLPISLIKKYF